MTPRSQSRSAATTRPSNAFSRILTEVGPSAFFRLVNRAIFAGVVQVRTYDQFRETFSRPDPVTGINPYRSTVQSIGAIAARKSVTKLWSGFSP